MNWVHLTDPFMQEQGCSERFFVISFCMSPTHCINLRRALPSRHKQTLHEGTCPYNFSSCSGVPVCPDSLVRRWGGKWESVSSSLLKSLMRLEWWSLPSFSLLSDSNLPAQRTLFACYVLSTAMMLCYTQDEANPILHLLQVLPLPAVLGELPCLFLRDGKLPCANVGSGTHKTNYKSLEICSSADCPAKAQKAALDTSARKLSRP